MKKTRQEQAQEQEDAWLDDNLADLAELSHVSKASPSALPDNDAAPVDAAETIPIVGCRTTLPEGRKSDSPTNNSAKAKRDDSFHNRNGK